MMRSGAGMDILARKRGGLLRGVLAGWMAARFPKPLMREKAFGGRFIAAALLRGKKVGNFQE